MARTSAIPTVQQCEEVGNGYAELAAEGFAVDCDFFKQAASDRFNLRVPRFQDAQDWSAIK